MAPVFPPRKVLLARPHSFVVDVMTSFMIRNGYEPVRVRTFEQIAQTQPEELKGVVISTAVSAEVSRSFSDVFAEIKNRFPSAPIAISGLGTFATTISLATEELGEAAKRLLFVRAEGDPNVSQLGRTGVLLVLRRDDVAKPELAATADAAVKRHFK